MGTSQENLHVFSALFECYLLNICRRGEGFEEKNTAQEMNETRFALSTHLRYGLRFEHFVSCSNTAQYTELSMPY